MRRSAVPYASGSRISEDVRLNMVPWPVFVVAGAAIGLLTGSFGVGGSSVATPLLSLLGVPGLLAIASPLPATIPSAVAAAIPYPNPDGPGSEHRWLLRSPARVSRVAAEG